MSKWQWRWVLVTSEDPQKMAAETLARYGEEWQFSLAITRNDSHVAIFALQPTFVRKLPGITRVPVLRVEVAFHGVGNGWNIQVFGNGSNTITTRSLRGEEACAIQSAVFPHALQIYGNLNGRVVTAVANQYGPWFVVENPECRKDPAVECVPSSGIDFDLLRNIGRSLNFSLRVVLAADGEWGTLWPNGSYSGMVGDVVNKRADVASCEITISADRRRGVDFSDSYYQESLRIVTSAPTLTSRAFVVLKPFDLFLWFSILASAALAVLVLKFLQISETRILGSPLVPFPDGSIRPAPNWSMTQYSLMVVEHLTGAGEPMPGHDAFQSFLAFWLMYSLVIGALYSGTLTAYMSVPGYTPSINDLQDLKVATDANLLTWGLMRGTLQVTLFEKAETGMYHDLWRNLVKAGVNASLAGTVQEGVQRVHDSDYAFAHGALAIKKSMAHLGSSQFHLSKGGFFPNFYGVVLRKGSPLVPAFNRRIFQLLSGGFIRKWSADAIDQEIAKALREGTGGGDDQKDDEHALKMDHLQGAFIVLALGHCCSFLAWVSEWVHHKGLIGRCCSRIRDIGYQKTRKVSRS